MENRRILGILILVVLTAVTVGTDYPDMAERRKEAERYRALLDTTPLAQVEGEILSPDGRFRVETADRTGIYISGLIVPEVLRVAEEGTGAVLWKMPGQLTQSAAWSPDGRFLALAHSTRTQSGLTLVDTRTWTDWDFTLPDGGPIPEYVFFPEDWAEWRDETTLTVTLGRGDGEEPHTYRCTIIADEGGQLTGSVLEETAQVLSEDYDFDHDGAPETTELVTVPTPETGTFPAWYILRVIRQDGVELWSSGAHLSHPGWTTVFACEIDGADYLLQYDPEMWQGRAEYGYELLAFDEDGQAYTADGGVVTFDTNFSRKEHQFDAKRLSEFFWKLRGILQNSTVLSSTENGEFQTGIPGLELQNYAFGDLLSLDSLEAMEAAVRQREAEMRAEQGVA